MNKLTLIFRVMAILAIAAVAVPKVFPAQAAAPTNDNFANATEVASLPFSDTVDTREATAEPNDPYPCGYYPDNSVWYKYSSPTTQELDVSTSGSSFNTALGIYTLNWDGTFSLLTCFSQPGRTRFTAPAGETIYFIVSALPSGPYPDPYPGPGGGTGGTLIFNIEEAVYRVSADFNYWPMDPSMYDTVNFYSWSYDEGPGIKDYLWLFPGDTTPREGHSQLFQFPSDGVFNVEHTVRTYDGREATIVKTVTVSTHDVAITKVSVPQTARATQTRQISISIKPTSQSETVIVELYKSSPYGYVPVGSLRQWVPLKSGNRTTEFIFNYTFTVEDARVGKVTFKAVASLDGRDALPADNEYISLPVKVGR